MCPLSILWILLLMFPISQAIECYTGSQQTKMTCPSISCVKQIFGMDTVRYCDGTGGKSVCQAYKIQDSCDTVPNVGYICCCSSDYCNPAATPSYTALIYTLFTFLLYRIL